MYKIYRGLDGKSYILDLAHMSGCPWGNVKGNTFIRMPLTPEQMGIHQTCGRCPNNIEGEFMDQYNKYYPNKVISALSKVQENWMLKLVEVEYEAMRAF